MAIFDNLGKKAATFAQNAAKKSGELVEATKLNLSIKAEEDKIDNNYFEIGKLVFQDYLENKELKPEVLAHCENIKASNETIAELKEKIMEVKNVKICSQCGAELEKSTQFCSGCGAKQEIPQTKEAVELEEKFCGSCGKKADPGQVFCSGCGEKLGE
jgi:ribosomal protein L40E